MDPVMVAAATEGMQQRYEHLLIGCALKDGGADWVKQICGGRRADSFSDYACQKFWAGWMTHGDLNRALLDARLLARAQEWAREVDSFTLAAQIVEKLDDQIWLNQTVNGSMEALMNALVDSDANAVERILYEMNTRSLRDPSQILDCFQIDAKFQKLLAGGLRATPSGLRPFDVAVGGFERQTQTILAARPRVGKTALASEFALQIAAAHGLVLFFSIEMPSAQWWARLACGEARLSWVDVIGNALTSEQKTHLSAVSNRMAERYRDRIRVDERPQSLDMIWKATAALRPDLVIIDHLALISDRERNENDTHRLDRISWKFNEMAKALDVPVLTLCQLNREAEKGQRRPQLSDLRDSGGIEQNAALVIGMHRDDLFAAVPTTAETVPVELIMLKARTGTHGGARTVHVMMNLPQQRFFPEQPSQPGQ